MPKPKDSKQDLNDKENNIFGGPKSKLPVSPNRLNNRRIIKKDSISPVTKIMTIGGDCKDDPSNPPAIILERDGDRITRIIVKCGCGRQAELECETEEENP